jgi:hypothetical protein
MALHLRSRNLHNHHRESLKSYIVLCWQHFLSRFNPRHVGCITRGNFLQYVNPLKCLAAFWRKGDLKWFPMCVIWVVSIATGYTNNSSAWNSLSIWVLRKIIPSLCIVSGVTERFALQKNYWQFFYFFNVLIQIILIDIVNCLKPETDVNNIKKSSSNLKKTPFFIRSTETNRLMLFKNLCVSWESQETHKYTLWEECRVRVLSSGI